MWSVSPSRACNPWLTRSIKSTITARRLCSSTTTRLRSTNFLKMLPRSSKTWRSLARRLTMSTFTAQTKTISIPTQVATNRRLIVSTRLHWSKKCTGLPRMRHLPQSTLTLIWAIATSTGSGLSWWPGGRRRLPASMKVAQVRASSTSSCSLLHHRLPPPCCRMTKAK